MVRGAPRESPQLKQVAFAITCSTITYLSMNDNAIIEKSHPISVFRKICVICIGRLWAALHPVLKTARHIPTRLITMGLITARLITARRNNRGAHNGGTHNHRAHNSRAYNHGAHKLGCVTHNGET